MSDEQEQQEQGGSVDVSGVEDTFRSTNTTTEDAPTSSVEEPVAAVAERPEYVPEQFWNTETGETNTEALVKSWKDTRKAYEQKLTDGNIPTSQEGYYKVSEDGNVVLDGYENLPAIASNDELFASFVEAAHGANLTRDQFTSITDAYFAYVDKVVGAEKFDPQAILGRIDSDPQRAKNLVDGVDVYLNGIGLDEAGEQVASQLMSSADGILFVAKLMADRGLDVIAKGHEVDPEGDKAKLTEEWHALRKRQDEFGSKPELLKRFEQLGSQIFA